MITGNTYRSQTTSLVGYNGNITIIQNKIYDVFEFGSFDLGVDTFIYIIMCSEIYLPWNNGNMSVAAILNFVIDLRSFVRSTCP